MSDWYPKPTLRSSAIDDELTRCAADEARSEVIDAANDCATLDELVERLTEEPQLSVNVDLSGLSDRAIIEGAENAAVDDGDCIVCFADRTSLYQQLVCGANRYVETAAAAICSSVAERLQELAEQLDDPIDPSEITVGTQNAFAGLVHVDETYLGDFDATIFHYLVEQSAINVVTIHELGISLSYTVPTEETHQ